MRVGYLGPEGTFSHDALVSAGPPALAGAELAAQPTLHDAVLAVHRREVDLALVPFENAIEGAVNPVLDALVFEAADVRIVGEVVHPVHHCLIAASPLPPASIRRIVSHPQASAQCAGFLRLELPGVPVVAASSTAEAVRQVAGSAQPEAALGPRSAAELYGCTVLRERVEDDHGNVTRFVWLARDGLEWQGPAGPPKSALVFWGGGDDKPGWLVDCLAEFASRGVNLTRIESRPQRQGLGTYLFLVELDGAESNPEVAAAVDGLRAHADVVRVLGSFPAA
jgi:prephenate dehydratase